MLIVLCFGSLACVVRGCAVVASLPRVCCAVLCRAVLASGMRCAVQSQEAEIAQLKHTIREMEAKVRTAGGTRRIAACRQAGGRRAQQHATISNRRCIGVRARLFGLTRETRRSVLCSSMACPRSPPLPRLSTGWPQAQRARLACGRRSLLRFRRPHPRRQLQQQRSRIHLRRLRLMRKRSQRCYKRVTTLMRRPLRPMMTCAHTCLSPQPSPLRRLSFIRQRLRCPLHDLLGSGQRRRRPSRTTKLHQRRPLCLRAVWRRRLVRLLPLLLPLALLLPPLLLLLPCLPLLLPLSFASRPRVAPCRWKPNLSTPSLSACSIRLR